MENKIVQNEEGKKPDMYITVPPAENGVDPVEFASRQKAVFGKEYNVIFVNPEQE